MRHALRWATGARRRAEPGKGSRGREVPRGGAGGRRREAGGRRAPSPAPRDLPAHRLVGQLAHAVELLLHRGPAAAPARERGEDAAARSPPQVTWPRAEPPGRRRRHCGASGSVWPARGSRPRAPPPTPPPAAAPAAASSSRAPPRLHGDARGRPRRRPGPPGRLPPAPLRRGDPGVSAGSWPAGRGVPAAPVRRAPCILGLVVLRRRPPFRVRSLPGPRRAEVGAGGGRRGAGGGGRRAGGGRCFALWHSSEGKGSPL